MSLPIPLTVSHPHSDTVTNPATKKNTINLMNLSFTFSFGDKTDITVRINRKLYFNRPAANFTVRHKKLPTASGLVNAD